MTKNPYYNNGLKNEYINSLKRPSAKDKSFFSFSAPFEANYKKDISLFTENELRDFLDKFPCYRFSSVENILIILRAYVSWVKDVKGLRVENSAFLITGASAMTVKSKLVANPKMLEEYLNKVFYSSELQSTDEPNRLLFWILFSGVPEEQLADIKTSDVVLSKRLIKVGGEAYQLPAEAKSCLENCVKLTSFVYFNDNYRSKSTIRDRVPGDMLLRGVRNANASSKKLVLYANDQSAEAFRNGLTDGVEILCRGAYLSGLFYRWKKMEVDGLEPDYEGYALLGMNLPTDRPLTRDDDGYAQLKNKVRRIKADYTQWNKAFFSV